MTSEVFKSRLKCGVLNCQNKSGSKFSLHLLPVKEREKNRFKKWIHALKLNPRKLPKKFVVCSNHFINNDFYEGI